MLTAGIVAAVASPLVAWMHKHGIPRGLGTALLMLVIIAIAVGMTVVVVGGIVGEATSAESSLSDAQDKIVGWLEDVGVDSGAANDARDEANSATTDSVTALLDGVEGGLSALSSLVFFLAMATLSLFFLLKDGPTIRAWTERHLGVPLGVGRRSAGVCSARCASVLGSWAAPSRPGQSHAELVALSRSWVAVTTLLISCASGASCWAVGDSGN